MKVTKVWRPLILLVVMAVALGGCVSGIGLNGSKQAPGTLSMYLTDAPANDIAEVNITIKEVHVRRDNSWEVLTTFEEEDGFLAVNLLDLRFDEVPLGVTNLPAGAYSEIRLIVDDSSTDGSNVTLRDGTVVHLKIPSGPQSGLKIKHNFVVQSGAVTSLTLDADVRDFVHEAGQSGKYIMNPNAIRVTDRLRSGTISGRVVADDGEPITDRDVTIQLYEDLDGEAIAQTFALPGDTDINGDAYLAGEFRFNAVPASASGKYIITITAEGFETKVIPEIEVLPLKDTKIDGDPEEDGVQPIVLIPIL